MFSSFAAPSPTAEVLGLSAANSSTGTGRLSITKPYYNGDSGIANGDGKRKYADNPIKLRKKTGRITIVLSGLASKPIPYTKKIMISEMKLIANNITADKGKRTAALG